MPQSTFELLKSGIASKEMFAIRYTDKNDAVTERVICPLQAYTLFNRDGLELEYVKAVCFEANWFRTFQVSRMDAVATTGKFWEPKATENGGEAEIHLLYPAQHRFAGNDPMIIEDYHPEPDENGVVMTVDDLVESGRWSYEPKELRRLIRRQLVQ